MRTRAYSKTEKPALVPLPVDPDQARIRELARIAGGRPVLQEVAEQTDKLRAMLADGPLHQADIPVLMGVPYTRAKRLIQKLRAAGEIEPANGKWHLISQKPVSA